MLGRVAMAIGDAGGDIGAVDLVESTRERIVRDITIKARDSVHGQQIVNRLQALAGVRVVNISDRTFLMHLGGKIEIHNKAPIRTRDDLSMAYTPGVARVCLAIRDDRQRAFSLTIKHNTVAVVTDGTAVLGLGDIGPEAALPVMEGKAMLFKEFAGVDAFPICLATKDVGQDRRDGQADRAGVRRREPRGHRRPALLRGRGAAAQGARHPGLPRRPARHRGRGAGRAAQRAPDRGKKPLRSLRVVVTGVGAAGTATIKILQSSGVRDIIGVDEHGTIHRGRTQGHGLHEALGGVEHQPASGQGWPERCRAPGRRVHRTLGPGHPLRARRQADGPRSDRLRHGQSRCRRSSPEEAERHVRVMATGRSDYPNQINNVLCFPGFFRGCSTPRARTVNDEMKLAAARALAACVSRSELSAEYIIPSVFNKSVAPAVADGVARAAHDTATARRRRRASTASRLR